MGRLPENVFDEYCARRKGILRALTNDVDVFFSQCDPERENLCLYGLPDGTWSVDLPAGADAGVLLPSESPQQAQMQPGCYVCLLASCFSSCFMGMRWLPISHTARF
jgi:hypothetical protein